MSIRYRVGSDHMMIMIKIKDEFDSDICTDKKCGLKLHFCVRIEEYSSIINQ